MRVEKKSISKTGVVMPALIGGVLACHTSAFSLGGPPAPQPLVGAPVDGLTGAELVRFSAGRVLYGTPLLIEDGLGPVLNKWNCRSCHSNPDGGPGNIHVTHFGIRSTRASSPHSPAARSSSSSRSAPAARRRSHPEANFTTNRDHPRHARLRTRRSDFGCGHSGQ